MQWFLKLPLWFRKEKHNSLKLIYLSDSNVKTELRTAESGTLRKKCCMCKLIRVSLFKIKLKCKVEKVEWNDKLTHRSKSKAFLNISLNAQQCNFSELFKWHKLLEHPVQDDDYYYRSHIVWKLLKMSHLNFGIFHHFLSY